MTTFLVPAARDTLGQVAQLVNSGKLEAGL
jgi:hypothetical protein